MYYCIKNKERRENMKKRLLSLFMAVCIVFGSLSFSPSAFAADTLVMDDHFGMFGAHLRHKSSITRNIDNKGQLESFTLDMEIYANYAVKIKNPDFTSAVDDYYVVDRPGRYLVELWGGDGASTTSEKGIIKGGAGGYVYGIINLEVGDVLLYTLGGAGQVSSKVGEGGGANGGGGYGTKGSTAVGGGGGYSAIYLYRNSNENEIDKFYSDYVDSDGHLKKSVSESDRLSKYVMIAGGGGGAGAANPDTKGSATGGEGGYVALKDGVVVSSTSGTLNSSDGYAVSGNFYSGLSGNSIDGTGEYAGKGGSYIPGKVVSTVWGWGSGDQPNDWTGSQNKNLIGGAGGAGNYRGGSGGAGFCGGSGGVMSNIVLASGVGGGGGGSSFIALSNDLFRINVDVERDRTFIVGRDKTRSAGEENTALGGRFHIVYLDEQQDEYLGNLDIEFARTPYFNISEFSAVNIFADKTSYTYDFITDDSEEERENKINIDYHGYMLDTNKAVDLSTEGSVSTLKFKIPHVSLKPSSEGYEGDYLKLTLTFVPKSDFAGGNNIPLFADDLITVKPSGTPQVFSDETMAEAGDLIGQIYMKNFCGYVNVPLNIDPAPMNHTPQGLDPGKVIHKVSSLYLDKYESVRENLSADWRYHFLEDISRHSVYDEQKNEIPVMNGDEENTVSPDETTRYFVSITATPKAAKGNNYAKLSDPVTTTTFSGISVITIAGTGIDALGKNMLVYQKGLEYSNGLYTLSLHVTSDSSGSIEVGGSKPSFIPVQYGGGTTSTGQAIGYTSKVTIPITGVYTISLKGGNGGKGGNSLLFERAGGNGGVGGCFNATFTLQAGTVLAFVTGANAEDTSTTKGGGAGGSPSYVAVCDSNNNDTILYYLMIAAGGGGGGGSTLISPGGNGVSPNSKAIDVSTTNKSPDDFVGKTGEAARTFTGGDAGDASANYVYKANDSMITYKSSTLVTPAADAPLGGAGNMVCDTLGDKLDGSVADVGRYTIETAISKYFTVDSVVLDKSAGNGDFVDSPTQATYYNKDTEANGAADYEFTKVVANINLTPEQMSGSDVYYVDFTLKINLVPRENFLGGNDVKLIEPAMATTGLFTGMKISQSYTDGSSDYIDVGENRILDYANVAIDSTLDNQISLTTQDRTYVYGDTLKISDLVVSVGFPDLSKYTWEDDYIKLIDPSKDETLLTPDKNTQIPVFAGVGPLYEEPYANIISSDDVVAVGEEKNPWVYTDFSATFELNHITLGGVSQAENGKYLIPFGPDGAGGYVAVSDYVFTLTAEETGDDNHNHHLPNKITIKVGDRELVEGTDYTYNRGHDNPNHATVATVTIENTSINGNVKVSAKACEEHHKIYYVYQNEPESSSSTTISVDKHYSEHVYAEDDFKLAEKPLPSDAYEHYTLVWDYGALIYDENEKIHVMPKGDAWVTGTYQPKPYTVTVKYLYDGTEAKPTYTESVPYNQNYSITSPVIEGKIANKAVVSGKVAGDVEIEVIYTDARGILSIYYLYADGREAFKPFSKELVSGDEYSVASPTITGYEPDIVVVDGEMVENGVVVTVTYSPVKPIITFDANGGSCSVTEKRVEYGNIYSYNADSGEYEPLPVPVRLGYTFDGWILDGNTVKAGDTVRITRDSTLVAKWTGLSFTVTVEYVTDKGVLVNTKNATHTLGEVYTINTPAYTGHNADIEVITGTMPAQNLFFTVTYSLKKITITVNYTVPEGVSKPSKSVTVLHGETYSIPSDEIVGYQPSMSVVSGTAYENDMTFEVIYYSTAISVEITWGAMDFSYDVGTWNPSTHTYEGGSFAPINSSNTVTVKNTSELDDNQVNVSFVYYPASDYSEIKGKFTDSNLNQINSAVALKNKEDSTTAYFWLEDPTGALGKRALPDNFVAGKCTVVLS